jgi:hypothetical protein
MNLARSQFRRRAAARRAHERMPAPLTTVDGRRVLRRRADDARCATAARAAASVLALRFLADLSVESTADVLRHADRAP